MGLDRSHCVRDPSCVCTHRYYEKCSSLAYLAAAALTALDIRIAIATPLFVTLFVPRVFPPHYNLISYHEQYYLAAGILLQQLH